MDEPEPQHAYDFFAPGPLSCYADNLHNINGWIEADMPLLGELGEMSKPLGAEVEEQMVAPVMDMEEDLAMLFGDDYFSNDGLDDDEDDDDVWDVNDEWLMAPVTPPPVPVVPLSSTYEVGGSSTAAAEGHSLTLLAPGVYVLSSVIEDLCTRMDNLEHGHGALVKKMMTVSDAEVADSIAIGEIRLRVYAVEGQVQVMTSQIVQAVSRLDQVGTQMEQDQQATTQRDEVIFGLSQQVQTLQTTVQDRDLQIQQLQTRLAEISSREGTLIQCIFGLDIRLVDVERRSSGPQ
ncbi:hypothetical protein Tco_0646720 [Tanacetum coccineum]